jgi:hypothetical protein
MTESTRDALWAPYRRVLDEIVDAIAAVSTAMQLEQRLYLPPNVGRDFRTVFLQRHPAIYEAMEQALVARNRAINEAARQQAKEQRLAKFKQTMMKKKATRTC